MQWLASIYIDVPALRPGTVGAYALAFLCAGAATLLRIAVDPYVVGVQYVAFFPAIMITTLISGFGAGLFCVVLSIAGAILFVLPPRLPFYNPAELGALMLFIMAVLAEVTLIAGMRLAIERDRASKDHLQLALSAAQLGAWRYDPRRHVASWDKRCQQIVDIAKDEAPLEELVRRVHPDDRAGFWAVREAALDPADPKPYANEYRILPRSGKLRWVETHGLAHFEGAGPRRQLVSFVGAIRDITERKEREEKERLLMREVNHRAKNMLSVVHAIAHQTATKNPEDFIERFSERIQALSANQDLLIRSDWNGVDIDDLVRAQLAHFAGLIGTRIALHDLKLRLNAGSAQAIGLALHELATNAGKYGALSTDRGRVDISWGIVGDTLTVTWTERGGPPVSAPERRGFGTIVMEAMAERSVNGTVSLDYAPSGLTWRLTCPAANALEVWERPQISGATNLTDGAMGISQHANQKLEASG
jgi:PAS domain S-box-containing protein